MATANKEVIVELATYNGDYAEYYKAVERTRAILDRKSNSIVYEEFDRTEGQGKWYFTPKSR